jgi:hypothetical protein
MSTHASQRNRDIDLMKALLIIGMVISHTFTLEAGRDARQAAHAFNELINLVSFSGFLFCMATQRRPPTSPPKNTMPGVSIPPRPAS